MGADAAKEPGRAPYQSTLRARHKEQTAQLILDSVAHILRQADLAAVSIAEVARVADVTERTVYRHYATRDDLVRAFIRWHLDQAVGGPHLTPARTFEELFAWIGRRFQSWETDQRVVAETYLSPLGRELRKPLFELGFANNMGLIDKEIPGLPEPFRRDLAVAMLTLISTENFVFLRQNLGWGPEQVYRAIISALSAMLDGARLRAAEQR